MQRNSKRIGRENNLILFRLEGGDSESYHSKNKAKRVRTTFTEEQLQVLQANFQLDSNPDGQDLERIAQITGLSKRVTQVWFQNSRARQKKHLHTGKVKNNAPSGLRKCSRWETFPAIPQLPFDLLLCTTRNRFKRSALE